jgi:hypothetical protein
MGLINTGLLASVVEETRELYQDENASDEDKFFAKLALFVFTANSVLFFSAAFV